MLGQEMCWSTAVAEVRTEHVDGRSITFLIYDDSFGMGTMLTDVGASMEIEPAGDRQTEFTFTFYHRPKNVMGRLMNPHIRSDQRKNRRKALRSIKQFAEAGEAIKNGARSGQEIRMSDRFWDEVGPLQAAGRLEEGTMFGFRCVRAGKAFVAMPGHESDGMVVKLPAERVAELLESGRGLPVAPAGKVFKEWVEITAAENWGPYLEEALEFAGG